jgi:hypothetical protein
LCILLTGPTAFSKETEEANSTSSDEDTVEFSGLFYIAYELGELEDEDLGRFFISRAYLTAEAKILPFLSARITLDTNQDLEGDGRGDMEVRLKYAFAKFDFGDWGVLNKVNLEAGIVHMVWLDFEEHINRFRVRGPMFMERSGIFNSADFGLTLAGGLGSDLDDEQKSHVNSKYAARSGSFAVGVYNGGGYHGVEVNSNKATEARFTFRPFPDSLAGLQVSGLAIVGEGNEPGESEATPDWTTYNGFVSYEHQRVVLTAQYVNGKGNQRGTWIEPSDSSQATPYSGWAVFGEWKFGPHWLVTGGYDYFDRKTVERDFGFDRVYAALGYDLGKQNLLMLDYDRREYDDSSLPIDNRYQIALQLKF